MAQPSDSVTSPTTPKQNPIIIHNVSSLSSTPKPKDNTQKRSQLTPKTAEHKPSNKNAPTKKQKKIHRDRVNPYSTSDHENRRITRSMSSQTQKGNQDTHAPSYSESGNEYLTDMEDIDYRSEISDIDHQFPPINYADNPEYINNNTQRENTPPLLQETLRRA